IFTFLNVLKVFKTLLPSFYNEKIKFFYVGQGDASLFYANNFITIIDGGPDNLVLEKVGKSLPYFSREIDFLILSHFHDDHVTGLIELVNRYRVKNLFILEENKNKNAVKELLKNSNSKYSFHNLNKVENTFLLKDVKEYTFLNNKITILNPYSLNISPEGNNSLLTKIKFNNQTILLSGDNELEVEKKILNSNFDISADIFKASHHGSNTSNSFNFLKKINMDKVVISVGEDNRYNHPSHEVIKRLKGMGLEVFRTDINGDIEIDLN
ncbi:MAG: MBL fold metallo-hydrolase, partial [Patescibacteria group bacterium]|nr:MBL fold metallo-hydrolase [Patescibacteria group bacterium]